jgi:hypothetical protein
MNLSFRKNVYPMLEHYHSEITRSKILFVSKNIRKLVLKPESNVPNW